MRVTIRDVAKLAGCSQATAARVLGGYSYASEETRRKVLAAAEALGYRPNRLARSMVTGRTQTIGLVVGEIDNPFFAALARAVIETVREHGYTVLLANSDENLRVEEDVLTVMKEQRVDGCVIAPVSSRKTSLDELLRSDMPVVLVDRGLAGAEVDTVLIENEEGACQAVSHLIQHGHTRIAVIHGDLDRSSNEERLRGYRRAFAEAGLPIDESLVRPAYEIEDAYRVVSELLREPDRPTALFTAHNHASLGAVHAIREAGLSVPEDIAVVGFDDTDWATLVKPQLTAVAQPVYEMGRTAAELLLRRMEGDQRPPVRVRIASRLMIRASCGDHPDHETAP